MKKAFIVVGIERSGNHLFCSLFSKLNYNGEPLLGTDMCGWEDGKKKSHRKEVFRSVWFDNADLLEISDGRSFATSRSIPSGGKWPDIRAFYGKCKDAGYDPLVVVIVRDQSVMIIRNNTKNVVRKSKKLEVNWSHIKEYLSDNIRYRFISYECTVQLKRMYFMNWLSCEDGEFDIDEKWFDHVIDANLKYIPKRLKSELKEVMDEDLVL